MLENQVKMSCGACGGSTMEVYCNPQKNDAIRIECQQCKSVTVISVKIPQLTIEMDEDSDGGLCILQNKCQHVEKKP